MNVLIEYTRSTCCRKKGEKMWTSAHLAKVYVRRGIAKIIKRKPVPNAKT
jgi:hypothetical protein